MHPSEKRFSQQLIAVERLAKRSLCLWDIPEDAKYIGLSKNGGEVCEHISFHYSIKKNQGSIFIQPKLIIGPSPYAHTKYSGIIGLNRFWARCITDSFIDLFKKNLLKIRRNFLKLKD